MELLALGLHPLNTETQEKVVMAMRRFYWRVLRRIPGVIITASGVVAALVFVIALAAVLVFSDKNTAQNVLGFHGYSPAWAAVPCGLIVAFLVAKANYNEALLTGVPTNRITTPATNTQVIAQAGRDCDRRV